MNHHEPRLFVPGPTEVFPEILQAMATPMISHRGPEIIELTNEIRTNLQKLFLTTNECYFAASSATGLMEGAVRNLTSSHMLATVCGAFGKRQYEIARKCSKKVTALEVHDGHPILPEDLDRTLSSDDFDLVTVVHSETSTGILNPMKEIGEVVEKYPNTLLVMDCVSSLAGAPVRVDEWGVDVAFAGIQKCMALPPGLCLFSVSEKAMERAKSMDNRGHYFDFANYEKMAARGQSPATTSIAHLFALRLQLERILDETLEVRWARHETMAHNVRERLIDRFNIFPHLDYQTPGESVFANEGKINVGELVSRVNARGKVFANGYGPLKEKTFRVGHMGDLQPDHVDVFMDILEEELSQVL